MFTVSLITTLNSNKGQAEKYKARIMTATGFEKAP